MPAPPSRRAALALTLVACLLAGLALRLSCARQGPPETARELLARLQAAGLDYDGQEVRPHLLPDGRALQPGFYLKRTDDSRPWELLALDPRGEPARTMRGYLVVIREPDTLLREDSSPETGRARHGPLMLVGDPAEIERVLAALH